MKRILFPLAVCTFSVVMQAQQDVFAITGKPGQQIIFNDFRTLDVNSNRAGDVLLTSEQNIPVYSQVLKSSIQETVHPLHSYKAQAMAAAAYRNGKMFYLPMFSSNIYVLDAATKAVTLVENSVIKSTPCDLGSQVVRMASAADGNIYALSNSGSQLIKISSEKGQYSVTDLGKVQFPVEASDPAAIQQMYGGDMIADAQNNLYVLAAYGNVYKLNLAARKAELAGKIKGLPEGYSVNGAAVQSNGKVLVASAKGRELYELDLATLEAKPMRTGFDMPVYDLASQFLYGESKPSPALTAAELSIYPTNVDQKTVNITAPANLGGLTADFYDGGGKKVLSKTLAKGNRTHQIGVESLPQGMYIVNVMDESGRLLITKKIIVTN